MIKVNSFGSTGWGGAAQDADSYMFTQIFTHNSNSNIEVLTQTWSRR